MSRPLLPALLLVLGACAPGLVAADAHAGHDHAGHAHGHAHGHATTSLGAVGIGSARVVLSAHGAPQAGGEWHVEATIEPASAAPRALRLWVGGENGRGSTKVKAEVVHDQEYAAHVPVPTTLGTEAQLWVSLERADGTLVKASVPLPGR